MECDEVYKYDLIEGNKFMDEKGEMECDNNIRHHSYPSQKKDRCLLHTQYISFGSINTKYYKTRNNYKLEDVHCCFNINEQKDDDMDMDLDCTLIAFSSYGQHYTSIYSYENPTTKVYNNYTSDFMKKRFNTQMHIINIINIIKVMMIFLLMMICVI